MIKYDRKDAAKQARWAAEVELAIRFAAPGYEFQQHGAGHCTFATGIGIYRVAPRSGMGGATVIELAALRMEVSPGEFVQRTPAFGYPHKHTARGKSVRDDSKCANHQLKIEGKWTPLEAGKHIADFMCRMEHAYANPHAVYFEAEVRKRAQADAFAAVAGALGLKAADVGIYTAPIPFLRVFTESSDATNVRIGFSAKRIPVEKLPELMGAMADFSQALLDLGLEDGE